MCLKLSNSGNTLKLLILNYLLKQVCGWTNHSGKVISQKMIENEMGYRGSKSALCRSFAVKEQRADGSWYPSKRYLRCALMGGASYYQVRFLSNQLRLTKLFFSTVSEKTPQLNPYFVTGFCDGESSFQVSIFMNKNLKWGVRALFTIGLHSRDLALLLQIKEFFGCGIIVKNDPQSEISYRVNSLQDLTNIIIPHFLKYPLLAQKAADFYLFKQVTELMKNKAHLKPEGIKEIINIKASMNLGLSDELKSNFINTVPVQRPTIKTTNIQDSNWISGFVSGEGNFFVDIFKSNSNKIGFQVKLRLSITQHSRDKELLELIVKILAAGIVNIHSENAFVFKVSKLVDLNKKIIPLFEQNPIRGVKQLDFLDFCEVAKLMNEGKHLTTEGLNLIRTIKNKMNTKREKKI